MKAYDVITEYGWQQGDYGDEEDGFCMVGALRHAYGIHAEDYQSAKARVRKQIGGTAITVWNDVRCRTREKVLDALIKADA